MMPNEVALSKVEAPGTWVMYPPPALMNQGSSLPASGVEPMPIMPFSDWRVTCTPSGRKLGISVGRPIPRLTTSPSCSSLAARRAIKGLICSFSMILRFIVIYRYSVFDWPDVPGRDATHIGGHFQPRFTISCAT